MNYLALISPMEDYAGKDTVMCNVKFLTGDRKQQMYQMSMTTDIFRFYFWGVTLEVVELDNSGNLIRVYDIDDEAKRKYNIGISYALTYNDVNHEILAANGFVYNIDESLFARYCRPVCERIYAQIQQSYNFALRFYTWNGAMLSLLFDANVSKDSPMFKYALNRGFIVADKKVLRGMSPASTSVSYDYDKNQKLKQEDIDQMLKDMEKSDWD